MNAEVSSSAVFLSSICSVLLHLWNCAVKQAQQSLSLENPNDCRDKGWWFAMLQLRRMIDKWGIVNFSRQLPCLPKSLLTELFCILFLQTSTPKEKSKVGLFVLNYCNPFYLAHSWVWSLLVKAVLQVGWIRYYFQSKRLGYSSLAVS